MALLQARSLNDAIAATPRSRPAMLAKRVVRGLDDLLAAIGHRVHAGAPRVVLFDVANPFGFDAQAPAIRHLLARRNVRVEITSGTLSHDELVDLTVRNGLRAALVVAPATARHRRYDATVLTDRRSVRVWRTTRQAFLHHGSSFADPYQFQLLREGAVEYLLCLAPAEVSRAIATYGEGLRARVAVTGQPKLDPLVAGEYDRTAFLESVGLDPARKTVLLSSHWTEESLYRSQALDHLRAAVGRPDVNLLVTAHYHLFNVAHVDFSGGIDWRARLESVFDGRNMRVLSRATDARQLMAAADVLVGDHSSMHLEYATLFRPMILYRHAAKPIADPALASVLEETASLVSSPAGIPPLLEHALASGHVDRAARRRLLNYCFAYIGRSGERAAEVIEALAIAGELDPDVPITGESASRPARPLRRRSLGHPA